MNTLITEQRKFIPCWANDLSETEFHNIIMESDIIVTQPISENYRGKHYLSTKYIVTNCRRDTKIFIFPSLHFDFYYPDLMYRLLPDGNIIQEPSDYHYSSIVDNYKMGGEYVLENFINNENYKSSEELHELAENSIKELERRESLLDDYICINPLVSVIKCSDIIRRYYKEKLLFYSMNHPTPYMIQYIAERIKNEIQTGNIDYNFDGLRGNERGIIYKCIQKCVDFDISVYTPRLNKYNIEDTSGIVKKYIECYNH